MALAGLGWALWTAVFEPLLAPDGAPGSKSGSSSPSPAPLAAAFLAGAGLSGASLTWFGSPFSPIPAPALAIATGAIVAGLVAAFTSLLEGDDPIV